MLRNQVLYVFGDRLDDFATQPWMDELFSMFDLSYTFNVSEVNVYSESVTS